MTNIPNKLFLNSIVRKYKTMALLNPYNLKVSLLSDTYLLDYRQLTRDNIEVISSVSNLLSEIPLTEGSQQNNIIN